MKIDPTHYRKLENMYEGAGINAFYRPHLKIDAGISEIEMQVLPEFFHAAGALHGSVYFKMLDDAAFFAVNSFFEDAFALTSQFHIHFLRPVTEGVLIARGKASFKSKRLYIGEARLYLKGSPEKEVAFGSGTFIPSQMDLASIPGYQL